MVGLAIGENISIQGVSKNYLHAKRVRHGVWIPVCLNKFNLNLIFVEPMTKDR
jgi:hypothetical protein